MASPHNPNTFTDNPLDRASHLRADPEWLAAARKRDDTLFAPLCQLRPLLLPRGGDGGAAGLGWVTAAQLAGADLSNSVFLGLEGGQPYFAVDVSDLPEAASEAPFGMAGAFEDLMGALGRLDARSVSLLAQAKSMLDWHRRHGFCAQCGAPTVFADGGYRRDCPSCKAQHFPRTDPVVISLVVRDGRCLLGRNAMFRGPMFSALAGFLEPGETVEEAVAREVKEEVGIEVGEVEYLFTQPWPFPSSLMIGCVAQALTEAITVDENEIAEARWFTREQLARGLAQSENIDYRQMMSAERDADSPEFFVPPASAIAHQLLRAWVEAQE